MLSATITQHFKTAPKTGALNLALKKDFSAMENEILSMAAKSYLHHMLDTTQV